MCLGTSSSTEHEVVSPSEPCGAPLPPHGLGWHRLWSGEMPPEVETGLT